MKKILIVDDDSDMQIFLSNLLEADGFSPIVAENSHDGLLYALKEHPGLIILDMPMMEKKGIQMLRYLKQDKRFNAIPVMIISLLDKKALQQYRRTLKGFSGQEMDEAEGYLKKPFEAEELLEAVRKIAFK